MSGRSSALVPNLVSLTRPLLGAFLYCTLPLTPTTVFALPVVLAACASDFLDGPLARRFAPDRFAGRLIDNLCDAAFLALCFAAMARTSIWTGVNPSPAVDAIMLGGYLPLVAFACAFATYLVRMLAERRRGASPGRSRFGHAGGVANYGAAIAGAVEAWPNLELPLLPLQAAAVAVALLNFASVAENVRLMFPRPAAAPRMPS